MLIVSGVFDEHDYDDLIDRKLFKHQINSYKLH